MLSSLLIRFSLLIVLLAHSIPTMLDGSINNFGNLYLNAVGFAPIGLPLAWAIKLSHVACAAGLFLEKYIPRWLFVGLVLITVFVLIMGIAMVHSPEGWFVVGAGRNGVEFNILLICILLSTLFSADFRKK